MNKTTRAFGVVLAVLIPILGSAHAQETKEYTWLTVGEPSGQQTVTYASDGTIDISFDFNDRGRGPQTQTKMTLNQRGVPVAVNISGKNYRKGTVDEQLSVSAGSINWSSSIEQGTANFDGNAFYWPNNAPPEALGMLARAILKTDERELALLPTGTAAIEILHQTNVASADENLTLTLYGISGINTSPTYVWLDEKLEFFGVDFGWFGITRKGYESHLGTLKQLQTEATDSFYERAGKTLTQPVDGLLVIANARIFDSLAGALTEPATVFVFDGRITAIYFDEIEAPEEARVIDATGQTLMPALWDMHAHVNIGSYFNYLAAGVTNVRDMANDHDVTTKLSADVRQGKIIGPDVFALGFVDKRGEFSAPTGRLADTLQDAMDSIDFYARHGYHGIKLYSSIEPEWVAPLARYAHERGLSVQGHVPAFMSAAQAIDAGYDELTHINMAMLNFLGAEELDTRTPNRFLVPGEKGGAIDLASQPVLDFIETMKARDIAIDPTLSIFMDMFLNEPGEVSWTFRDIADHLPATARRNSIASVGFNDGKEGPFKAAAANALALTRQLHDAGIRVLPGTDNSLPGFTLIRELAYYVQAGIPTNEALQLATIESARHMGQDQRLGSVSIGKEAHIYLVDGDPVADISALYRVRHVVKGRQMYFAPDVLRTQGFVPF